MPDSGGKWPWGELSFRSKENWVQTPAATLTSCVTLGQALFFLSHGLSAMRWRQDALGKR